jgi:redox-sensitive bicupin YhaK (pirin superfamily)
MPALTHVLDGTKAPVGDFSVIRALPKAERRFIGPFCFLDHMGPSTQVGEATSGVGPHPHIGLATITYLFEGEVLHRDSLGTVQRIRPGDVNWMSAGRGIVHSERPPPDRFGAPMTLHGLQLWVGLPTALEESEPSFQHASAEALPRFDDAGVRARVVLGSWRGASSPIRLASPTVLLVAELDAGATLELPAEVSERGVYVVSGDVGLDGTSLRAHQLGVLAPGVETCATAVTPARVAVVGGEPLDGPRFMLWNWVSSRRERLEQARLDWRHGRFPRVPGDDDARIPGPGE